MEVQENQTDRIESNSRGAPLGNSNAAKGRQVTAMLETALNANDKLKLRQGIEKIADAFAEGEVWAVNTVFDRLEGKASQSIDANITGELSFSSIVRAIIDPANNTNT